MKKIVLLIISAAAVGALLTACGAQNKQTQTQEQDFMTQFTVETQQLQKQWYTDDKTVLLAEYNYGVPHMVPADGAAEVIKTAAETFNAETDKYFADLGDSFAETSQYAKDQYKYELDSGYAQKGSWDMHYTDDVSCEAFTVGKLLSVRRDYSTYAGGAHGYAYSSAWNFDVEHAKFISDVTTLGADSQKLHDAVYDEILRQVGELSPEITDGYWDDYKDIISNWNVDYYTWFTPDGMYVSFPSYTLAPYAAGEQRFLISYDVISPLLSDTGKTLLGLT